MKDLINFENIMKILGGLFTSFALVATPTKIVIAVSIIMLSCVFAFSIWAFYTLRLEIKSKASVMELFESRYLQTEAKVDLLTEIHIGRHDDDGCKFYELADDLNKKRFDYDKSKLCGARKPQLAKH